MITAQQAAKLSLSNVDHDFNKMISWIENEIKRAASERFSNLQ